jgi:SAM-dependent methyltransferase
VAEPDELDEYASDVHRWWHLSGPSPELLAALRDGWFPAPARVLDVGCGLASELGHLATIGSFAVGIDLSLTALARARTLHPSARFAAADARRLPFAAAAFDAALDRGCFHYLPREDRPRYAAELARLIRPGGRLLLRACTTSEDRPNDISKGEIRRVFLEWQVVACESASIESDTRSMPALIVRLERP